MCCCRSRNSQAQNTCHTDVWQAATHSFFLKYYRHSLSPPIVIKISVHVEGKVHSPLRNTPLHNTQGFLSRSKRATWQTTPYRGKFEKRSTVVFRNLLPFICFRLQLSTGMRRARGWGRLLQSAVESEFSDFAAKEALHWTFVMVVVEMNRRWNCSQKTALSCCQRGKIPKPVKSWLLPTEEGKISCYP